MIGAVVGVQPFGGEGLSGTGPKAGGPLYLHRLLAHCGAAPLGHADVDRVTGPVIDVAPARLEPLHALRAWLAPDAQHAAIASLCDSLLARSPLGQTRLLPGPTGERNTYTLVPRRAVLCVAPTPDTLLAQLALVLAAGSRAIWLRRGNAEALRSTLPDAIRSLVDMSAEDAGCDAGLVEADAAEVARAA